MSLEKQILKRGSRTFFASSLLFPKEVRRDVFDLYSFLRVADDYVDEQPARPSQLKELKELWLHTKNNPSFNIVRQKTDTQNQRVIKNIVRLSRKHDFDNKWVDEFLEAMESDLDFKPKKTLNDSLAYTIGSSEVVGLMISRVTGLPAELDEQARLLGRAYQWINFIRDIEEDNQLGRCYFPSSELAKFNLKDLNRDTTYSNREGFEQFINFQIDRYLKWQTEASQVFNKIPKRRRIPLQVACSCYLWTASKIQKDSMAIFEGKIKPSRATIAIFVFKHLVRSVR